MPEADEGAFKVTDRRRRSETSASAADTASSAPTADRDLRTLFMMLATEAFICLGDVPDPATGERRRDLPRSSDVIDLLMLLREKTQGNRTADESELLEQLLYDLQIRYVDATKSAG